jgi:hypothetical protein
MGAQAARCSILVHYAAPGFIARPINAHLPLFTARILPDAKMLHAQNKFLFQNDAPQHFLLIGRHALRLDTSCRQVTSENNKTLYFLLLRVRRAPTEIAH